MLPTRAPTAPFVGFALASLLLLSGCVGIPPVAERYIPPPIGATVEYRATNSGSYGAGTSTMAMKISEATWEGRTLRKYEYAGGATLQSPSAGTVAVLDPSGKPLMRYNPPLDFNFPLVVGKTWTTDHELTVGAATKLPMKTSWKVEAYEDITVPAGTFKAWRLVMTDNFGFRQTNWSVPDKMGMFAKRISERPAGHPQGAGTQILEMTKVPAIR